MAVQTRKTRSKAATAKSRKSTKSAEIVTPKVGSPRRKPIRAISKAVFRGERAYYYFKVYAINENFREVPGVYIISKRKTDRRNRGHHKIICIGQTDSVIKDIRAHRRGKCLRPNSANVVSILREENEEKRLRIENDLKAAHTLVCNLG
ncbi:MAG: hypothetical protein R2747_00685 [Pyrinomonadaceae bacterium]